MSVRKDRTGEEGFNKKGLKMIITRYKNYGDVDIYFPDYDYTSEHRYYGDFKKGEVSCPLMINPRIGEENYNNLGSKMVIKEYRTATDMDVYFPKYDWIFKGARYSNFKIGKISCPYEPSVLNKGYFGEGKYSSRDENGCKTKCYNKWRGMLQRCYDDKYQEKHPSYKGCQVEDCLLNFQNFGEWFDENYYEIEDETMCLDKDILNKGNKIYSKDNCIFVPNDINVLFTKSDKIRGDCPIGVTYRKRYNIYEVYCNRGHKQNVYLGRYNTPEEAFQVYKSYKEKVIKDTIDSYEGIIPEPHCSKLKEAMYNYKVEITD